MSAEIARERERELIKSDFIRKTRPAARPLRYLKIEPTRRGTTESYKSALFTKGSEVQLSRVLLGRGSVRSLPERQRPGWLSEVCTKSELSPRAKKRGQASTPKARM